MVIIINNKKFILKKKKKKKKNIWNFIIHNYKLILYNMKILNFTIYQYLL